MEIVETTAESPTSNRLDSFLMRTPNSWPGGHEFESPVNIALYSVVQYIPGLLKKKKIGQTKAKLQKLRLLSKKASKMNKSNDLRLILGLSQAQSLDLVLY